MDTEGVHDGAVIGEVGDGGIYEHQTTDFTCAVVSQEMILKDFGVDVSEAQLAVEAAQNGWLSTGGTMPEDVGSLLELHGVQCHQSSGMENMVQDLSQGHKVIVGVDADELWNNTPIANELNDLIAQTPNHALVVQGIKQQSDGSWSVVVNDPGDPHGAGKEYPLDQFADAWKDSNCFYTATDIAPPHLEQHPALGAGFNAAEGHYDGVMEWLHEHSTTIQRAAIAGGLGLAAMPSRIQAPPPAQRSEGERNDLLRNI